MNGRTRSLRGMSLRAKAMLLISLLVVGILSVVAASVLTRERARGLAHLRQRGVKIADTLATTCLVCLLRDDVSLIGEIGDSVRPRPDETIGEADLRYLSIFDLAGNRLYAWGTEALKPEHDAILTGNIFRDDSRNRVELLATLSGEEVMDVSSKMTLTEVFKISVSPLIVAAGAGAFAAARAALDSSVGHLETLSTLLLELLNDPEPRVVASAVQALARSRDSRAIRPLVRALSGDSSHRDGQVLSTLERIGAPSQTLRALDRLRKLAGRPGE